MKLNMKYLPLLLLLGSSPFVHAQVGISLPFKRKECPQFQYIRSEANTRQSLANAAQVKRACSRAEVLYSLAFETSGGRDFADFKKYGPPRGFRGSSDHETVQKILVETLLEAGDTVETINQANVYLDYYGRSRHAKTVHYQLLLAQEARILDKRRSQTDTYIAIGANPEQIQYKIETTVIQTPGGTTIALDQRKLRNPQFNEHLYRRSFASFLETYGTTGTMSETVMEFLDNALIRTQEKELEVGLYYYQKKEYMAAIGRFKNVTNAGPVLMFTEGGQANFSIWDEAAYYTALSFMELGTALLNLRSKTVYTDNVRLRESLEAIVWMVNKKSMLISDNRIADWLRMDRQDYNPEKNRNQPSRSDLARISFQNVGLIVAEMRSARGNSPFKAKLERDLRKKMTPELRALVPDLETLLKL